MRKRILVIRIAIVIMITAVAGMPTAWASSFTTKSKLVQVSGASPFATCTADDVPGQEANLGSTNVPNSEVEPWVDVNPKNSSNIVGVWQQDRWSDGGARGLVAGFSTDGGAHWDSVPLAETTVCAGGNATNGGDFKRASDPWLSFSPDGDLYAISLSLDLETPPGAPGGFGKNALLVSKSTDGGATWGHPTTIIRDEDPKFLNDKESITADPADPNFVYALWDRLENANGTVINPEHVFGFGFKGPAMFSRTTNDGASWEPARIIYNPGANNQTIGNQVVVLPNGTLVDFFNEILNFKNAGGESRLFNLSLIHSTNKGATWTNGQAIRAAKMFPRTLFVPGCCGVHDPDTNAPIRTADIIPEVAVDRNSSSAGFGNLYAVWQDARFSNGGNFSNPALLFDEIAFSMSTDGGNTWSTPIKVNKTPSNSNPLNRQAFTPSVQVASDGTIGVTYYDFRNNTSAAPLDTDYFIVHCHPSDGCADSSHWSETKITKTSFDMTQAPLARGFFTGDYEGLASSDRDFIAFFSQSAGDPASIFFRKVGP